LVADRQRGRRQTDRLTECRLVGSRQAGMQDEAFNDKTRRHPKIETQKRHFLQDHLYVQYVELNQFQNEFRELANKFGENEKIIKKLSVR
jgi:hypothetical protein